MSAGADVVRTTATSTATKAAKITPTSKYVAPIVLVRMSPPRMFPLPLTLRHDHDETTAPPALRRAARLAPVPPRNLPHQRKPQPRACDLFGSRVAVERVEHALALGLGNARAVVADGQFRAASGAGEAYLNRRSAVAFCIFQQVADHPAQQPRIAAHHHRLAVELGAFVARALLSRKREQVHIFIRLQVFQGVEAAGEQD